MIADVDALTISFSSPFVMFVFGFFFVAGISGFFGAVIRPLLVLCFRSKSFDCSSCGMWDCDGMICHKKREKKKGQAD